MCLNLFTVYMFLSHMLCVRLTRFLIKSHLLTYLLTCLFAVTWAWASCGRSSLVGTWFSNTWLARRRPARRGVSTWTLSSTTQSAGKLMPPGTCGLWIDASVSRGLGSAEIRRCVRIKNCGCKWRLRYTLLSVVMIRYCITFCIRLSEFPFRIPNVTF